MNGDLAPAIGIFTAIALTSIAVMLGALAWTMVRTAPPLDHSRQAWRKRLRTIGLAVGLSTGFMYWSRSYWYDEIDRVVMWAEREGFDGNISQAMAKALPTSLGEAIVVLRRSGYNEGSYIVGAVHHYRPVPEPGEASELQRRIIRRLNEVLEDHDAISVRPFSKRIPQMIFEPVRVQLYLLLRRDGSMAVYARRYKPVL